MAGPVMIRGRAPLPPNTVPATLSPGLRYYQIRDAVPHMSGFNALFFIELP